MRSGNLPSRIDLAERSLMPPMKPVWCMIDLLLALAAGEHDLLGIDDDDVVAVIDMRRVGRLVLAAQPHGDDRGEPADDQALASISTHFFSMSAALAE